MTTWGNPETKSFGQNLRLATYGDTKVPVNRLVWPIVERIFQALEQRGTTVSAATEAEDPQKRGFHLNLGEIDDEMTEWLTEALAPAQFEHKAGEFLFTGEADEAEAISAKLAAAQVEAEQVPEIAADDEALEAPVSVEKFSTAPGDQMTVKLIQALTGLPLSGDFDERTRAALVDWQNRRHVAPTGEIDADTWSQILPGRVKWLRPGATGLPVSVMQAAFKVHGFYPGPVTGVWGVELSQALRRVQAAYKIHPRLRIGLPEWDTFFEPRV